MSLIAVALTGIVLVAATLWLASFLAGTAELAWQFWPKKGEKAITYLARIGAWALGGVLTIAGVIGIIGSLTSKPGTPLLPKLALGAGGLLVAVLGMFLFTRNSKEQ